MENASKALIMGVEILIGVMVISIAVYLFSVLGQYSAETTAEMESTKLQQFNEQFTKYYGTTSTLKDGKIVNEPIKCTLQDIVGTANMANMYNKQNGFEEPQDVTQNPGSYYIQVDVDLGSGPVYKNLEDKTQDELINILKDDGNYGIRVGVDQNDDVVAVTKYFKVTEIRYSDVTQRVNYIKFVYDASL